MTDALARPTSRQRGPARDGMRARPRRPARLLETCGVCGRLFDLRTQPAEASGRHCSTACLATAQRILGQPRPGPITAEPAAPPSGAAAAAA
ncbi:MAG: hypothetical protein QOG45_1977 [Chloroflexota bacterium]|nr:hypothetical protein [Chloroflexota bacterium]